VSRSSTGVTSALPKYRATRAAGGTAAFEYDAGDGDGAPAADDHNVGAVVRVHLHVWPDSEYMTPGRCG
jgi:hypothetical protein